MITKYMKDFESFMRVWKEFTMDRYSCQRIKSNHLMTFFRRLSEVEMANA